MKRRYKQHSIYKRRHGWTNLKKIKTDDICGFWKLANLTVLQSSLLLFVTILPRETYLFDMKLWFCFFAKVKIRCEERRATSTTNKWTRQACQCPFFGLIGSLIKEYRWRRQRKRHLKKGSRAALNSIELIPSRSIRQMLAKLELNSKRLQRSSGKEKESRRLMFTSSTKRKIRHFHFVVAQQRNAHFFVHF